MRLWQRCGILWAVLFTPGLVCAEDVFLTIGGGYNPAGNQVSLEKNTLLFQRMLAETYPDGVQHDIFFADGDGATRDVQFVDPEFEVPRANELLAELFGDLDEIDFQYRNHEIPDVDGATTRDDLERWFQETGPTLARGDRLFIYVTAHGGRSPDKESPHDTVLFLWNRRPLRVHDLAAWLNHVPHDVPVIMVMVQCYSGGFAYSMFEGAAADAGLADGHRCGFFATVHDRVAAGCTPDIDEANYQEYSTSFFEALRGSTRDDVPLESPDYDGDGRTSLAEAHAYVVLTSTTIDIPVCTSEEYLRAVTGTGAEPQPEGEAAADQPGKTVSSQFEDVEGLLSAEANVDDLLAMATPVQRAVVEGLSDQLDLHGPQRAEEARHRADEFEAERKRIGDESNEVRREYDQVREQIKQRLLARWPELKNRWHPATTELLTTRADELLEQAEGHRRFGRLQELSAKLDELATAKMDYERLWVKCRRLERALETLALTANLPLLATDREIAAYQQLVAAEGAFFGPQSSAAVPLETALPVVP